jgi:Cupredoxin-like domain
MATTTAPDTARGASGTAGAPRRSARLATLVTVGLIDSFGMTLGWTVFSLLVLRAHGLAGLGTCSAAMLVGVALSAPATAWLSPRMGAGALLRVTATVEGLLRVASFVMLLGGAPVAGLAAAVVVMFTAGLSGYAGMRAEVSAASRPDRAAATMTFFVVAILAVEAAGIASAALLPGEPPGSDGELLRWVVAFYGASSFPIWLVARGARVGRAPRRAARRRHAANSLPLAAGAVVMLLGSGPALLAVGLAAELYGSRWVAGSALAFTAGALLAPWAVGLVERLRLPAAVTWPAWGTGMLLGWSLAQTHVAGLLFAQVLAGLCIAAFEGSMDAHIAARQARGQLMGSLAASEAVRALGSAAAVAALPAYVGTGSIAAFSGITGTVLLATTVLAVVTRPWTWSITWRPVGTPAVAFAAPGMTLDPRSVRPVRSSQHDWRRPKMSPLDDRYPGDTWARDLRRSRSRSRRRRPVVRWVAGVLLLAAVGAGMFEVGRTFARTRPPAAQPAGAFQGASQPAVRAAATPARPRPAPAATPVRPRVLKLVTRNIRTEANPNRVYLVPGKLTPGQASHGARPSFVVRPGEALRMRVDNQDQYVHSFTFAKSRVNLDAWEGEVSTTATFRAPTTPGTYQFYCRYRKVGMSGTLVVR